MNKQYTLGIIGLGYVGLPLAVAFAKKYTVVGFDVNGQRVEDLRHGKDATLEIAEPELLEVIQLNPAHPVGLTPTTDASLLTACNVFIVTVPTPVDKHNKPDLTPLYRASETVGKVLKPGDMVVYESTVYPGVTEEECVPVLETVSGLKFNEDFFVGYSPERINPGDKEHTVTKILKVTSGSTPEAAQEIDALYASIITAGTHLAPSIKVAEAAKVIENSQRDINIAFVNELAKIFNLMGIDTHEVLAAAGTKWNFLSFKPGLVGGHCIGVDPYYLAQKAQELGYHPEIILAGRRLNDGMGKYVAGEIVKKMIQKNIQVHGAKVLVLGVTFKENCPDVRNSKVFDVVNELEQYCCHVILHDPWINTEIVKKEFNKECELILPNQEYDAVILAVSHSEFRNIEYTKLLKSNGIIYDVKGILNNQIGISRL